MTDRTARERSWRNRYSETHRGILDDPDRIDTDGVLGEKAFAMYMGLSTALPSSGPVSANFVLESGVRVDVRSSRAMFCKLLVPPSILKRGTIDVFVLAEIRKEGERAPRGDWVIPVDGFIVLLQGWMGRESIAATEPMVISQRPGATPVHCIEQRDLRPMEELVRYHKPHMNALF